MNSFLNVLAKAVTEQSPRRVNGTVGVNSQRDSHQSTSGQSINDEKALKLSAVWACVGLISDVMATLPLNLYERLPDGGRKVASDHPLQSVLHSSPNYNNTPFEFWQIETVSTLLRGNGYSEIKRDRSGQIISIDFLSPNKVKPYLNSDGSTHYIFTDLNGKERKISESDIMHIRGFTLDGFTGLSAIQYGANIFGAAMSADLAAGSTFKNGLMPAIAFKTDKVIKKEQREEFRESVQAISGALNAGKSPILEYGLTPESIGISPSDAQLLDSRSFSVAEICRWFRVMPWMIGHTEKSTSWGSGLEQQMIGFATFTLNPWTTKIQQSINKHLLSPVDRQKYYAEFSLDGLLKGDSSARAAFYSAMVNNGIYTRDEIRVKENLPKRGGNADVLTIQTAMAPIDELGKSDK